MFGKGFDASVVLREGTLGYIGPGVHKKQIMFLGDEIYHIKQPHSKYFKNNAGDFGRLGEELDNQFASATELLAEMRYRAYHIPYAYYESLRGANGEFQLVSKDISNDKIEIAKAIENPDKNTVINELKAIFKVINATDKTMQDNLSKISAG